ncbi:MAG TPA: hypothetical protein VNP04_01450 [Alphaproteobacteria bacterium]|nr:hypothetical protein [Alphaproteobacteria bacterium]
MAQQRDLERYETTEARDIVRLLQALGEGQESGGRESLRLASLSEFPVLGAFAAGMVFGPTQQRAVQAPADFRDKVLARIEKRRARRGILARILRVRRS